MRIDTIYIAASGQCDEEQKAVTSFSAIFLAPAANKNDKKNTKSNNL